MGVGFRHTERPGPMGRRAAQYVEAHASGIALVPWWESCAIKVLFALSCAAAQGADHVVLYALTGRADFERRCEAARALGLEKNDILAYIVLPQALAKVYPSLVSQFVFLFLTTGIISEVGVEDLTWADPIFSK